MHVTWLSRECAAPTGFPCFCLYFESSCTRNALNNCDSSQAKMSQKYSITAGDSSNSNRRKSVFTPSLNSTNINEASAQTIELERLEQEITLTLQSIDKSFAKSHKIINDKLIPIVKRYHANSKKIWTGVNFWKTFLETSANVELRGYEEAVENQNDLDKQQDQDQDVTIRDSDEQMSPIKVLSSAGGDILNNDNDILMESTNHTHQQFQKRYTDNFNAINEDTTTDERLKINPIMPSINKANVGFDTTDSILPPIPQSANLSNTNGTDVNQTTPTLQRTTNIDANSKQYLIHNNLDTNYKVEVTPRKKKHEAIVNSVTPNKPPNKKRKSFYQEKFDSSPFEIETPKLNSDVQFSPVKAKQKTPLKKSQPEANEENENQTQRFPHTPRYGAGGILLHTPGQVSRTVHRYSGHNFQNELLAKATNDSNTMDDSEEVPNISPPVTLKFATVPGTETLTKTPAREAAQNIVKDILNNVSGINDSGASGLEGIQNFEVNSSTIEAPKQVLEDDFDAFLDKPQDKKETDDWSE